MRRRDFLAALLTLGCSGEDDMRSRWRARMTPPAPPRRKPIPVIIQWGRSNMSGHGFTPDLPIEEQGVANDTRWMEWEYLDSPWLEPPQDQVWHPGGIQVRYNQAGTPRTHVFGPDVFTGRGLADAGRRVAVLKYASGGTPITQWKKSAGLEYQAGMNTVQTALAALGQPYKIIAFCFFNCEGESAEPALTNYQSDMDSILGDFRTDMNLPGLFTLLMTSTLPLGRTSD
jgi:carbohydrate esterase-like sialic acid-specific acetylesterase